VGTSALTAFYVTEYRLRDRNGVLELALMLASDRLREHEGGEELDVLEGLIGEAERRLLEEGRLPRPFLNHRAAASAAR